ncbi:hypothetical protein [Actinocrispum wychmicini]|uniref:PASTA domain-containing protein n=1 Tax=Actinocrispum wychmicini TaxID=1213861 RepID=A0A4R2JYN5_9PSEU|nr:hypothetical protein [Actinocrispum wychmicini]TCO64447.1 hypothetical protein EV192_101222 [Actinocrispum wychmicini]
MPHPDYMHDVTESKTSTMWVVGVVAAVVIILTFFDFDDSRPVTTIPVNLGGQPAASVDRELRGLGFANIMYSSPIETSATVHPEWTVVSVDGAGQTVGLDSWIMVRVH